MQTRERHRLEPVVYDPEMAPEVVAWLEAQREKRGEYEEEHGPWISHRFAGGAVAELLYGRPLSEWQQ